MAKKSRTKKPLPQPSVNLNSNDSFKKRTKNKLLNSYRDKVSLPLKSLTARRPHRSFRRTRRRDYIRSLDLPGYWAFTFYVAGILKQNRKLFTGLVLIYAILSVVLVGISSQDTYSQLRNVVETSSGSIFSGGWGELGKAGLLLASGLTGSFAPQLGEAQQIYAGLLVLITWLTTVWLLRAILTGSKPKLRDGIYSAGSPLVPTVMVSFVMLIQLIPLALALISLGAATTSELPNVSTFLAVLVLLVSVLLSVLSIYWIVGTFMALIIVTLPGMYPWQAIRTAGDLVVGRRVRILLRLLWMLLSVALFWVTIVIPVIIFEGWLVEVWEAADNLQIVPIAILLVSSISTVWASSYIYLLYRKIVEDDADPA